MKQEKGSALIMTVLLVAVLGVIALGTASAVNHNYQLKEDTLSSEKIDYTAKSAVEYSNSYITKLLNTTFTYTMYYDSSDPDNENWKALKEDSALRKSMGLKESFCTNMTTFNGIVPEYGAIRPYPSNYSNNSDYEDAFNQWKQDLRDDAKKRFDDHIKNKLYYGQKKSPLSDSRTCKPTVLLEDLQVSMDKMCSEMNTDFDHNKTGMNTINSITVEFTDFSGSANNPADLPKLKQAEKVFLEDGYLNVKFTVDMPDKTIIQPAKFKWDAHSIIDKFCDVYSSAGTFKDSIKVKVYYEKPSYINK